MGIKFNINKRGFWEGLGVEGYHHYDKSLCEALILTIKLNNFSVYDFGCGLGDYTKAFLAEGIDCEGFDGNPDTVELTSGVCKVLDLSKPIELPQKDLVMCLEVGEHLPKKFENIIISNIHKSNSKAVLISWAIPGQGGDGHVNERPNSYIKDIFKNLGYDNDISTEIFLRKSSTLFWFKNTIMFFRKT